MAAVSDIMQSDVITVDPELTLRELVGVLTGEEITGAPVVSNGQVVGVVSMTDVVEFGGDAPGVPIERDLNTEDSESALAESWEEGEIPLSVYYSQLWEPQEVGVRERMEVTDRPEWNVLEEHTVGEVMSRRIVSVSPDAPVRDAARMMVDDHIHRVLVIGDDSLMGILTTTDIVRALAEGRL